MQTFDKVTAEEQPWSVFDPVQFGCPPPVPPPTYSISGYITDATNLKPITSALVSISSGGVANATTDSHGKYTFSGLEAGTYTIKAAREGFISDSKAVTLTNVTIPAGTFADISLSPILPEGNFRIVLTWADRPRDLDSHLLVDNCEVYYSHRYVDALVAPCLIDLVCFASPAFFYRACATPSDLRMGTPRPDRRGPSLHRSLSLPVCCRSCASGGASVSLDVDVTTGFGPETITINSLQQSNGEMKHFVYIYSTDAYFGVSQAEVKLFGARGLVDVLTVPAPTSTETTFRYWNTWNIKRDGSYTRVNTLVSSHP